MKPTNKQISAAHDAWEATLTEWKLRMVSNYGIIGDVWLVERHASPRYEAGRDYANEIAAHRFEGGDAEQRAKFMLRDKCIVAMLTAVIADNE